MSANEGDSGPQEDDSHVYGYLLAMEDEGPGAKKIFGIGKTEIRIGRGSKNDIRLNARMFSRHHVTLSITKEDGIVKVNLQNLSAQKDATRAPYAIANGSSVTLDSPSVFLLQNRRFHWILNDGNKESVQNQCKEPISYIMEGSQCSEDADENSLNVRNMVEYSPPPGTSKSRKSYSAPSPSRKRRSSANTGLELRKAAIKGSFRSQQQNRPSSAMSILKEAMEKADHTEGSARLSQSFDLITFSPESKADTSLPEAEKSDVSLIDLRSFVASPGLDEGEESQSQTSNEDELQIQQLAGSPKIIEDGPVVAGIEQPVTEDVLKSQSSTTLLTMSSSTPIRSTRSSSVSQGITNVVAETSLVGSDYESEQLTTPKQVPPISKASAKTPIPQNEKADVSMIGLRSFFATPTPVTQENTGSRTPDQHDLQIETPISSSVTSTPATPKRSTRSSSVSQDITNEDVETSLLVSDNGSGSEELTTPKQAPRISKPSGKTPLLQNENEKADVSMIELRSFFATPTPVTQQKAESRTPDQHDLQIETEISSSVLSTPATPKRSTRSSSVPQSTTNVVNETCLAGSDYGSESKETRTPKQAQPISKAIAKTPHPQNEKADVSVIGLGSFFATPVPEEKAGCRTPDQHDLHIQTAINSRISSTPATRIRSTRSSSISQDLINVSAETSVLGSDYGSESEEITTPKQAPRFSKTSAKTPLPQNEKADVSMIGLRSFFATPTPVTQDNTGSRTPDQHDLQIETTISSSVTSTPATPKRSTRSSSVYQELTNVAAESSLVGSDYESEETATPKQAPRISKASAKTPLPQNEKTDVSMIGLTSFFATPTSVAQEKAGSRTPDQNDLQNETTIISPISSTLHTPGTPKRSTRSSSVYQELTNVAAESSLVGSDYESEETATPKQAPRISKASAKTPLPQNEKTDVSMIGLTSFFATPTSVAQEKAGSRTPDQNDLQNETTIISPISSTLHTPGTPKRSTRSSSVSQGITNVVAETSLAGSDYESESEEITTPTQAPRFSKTSAKTPLPQNEKADVSMIGLRSFFATPVTQEKAKSRTPDQHDLPIQTAINVPVSSTPATPIRSTRASSVFQSITNVVAETSLAGSDYESEFEEITTPKQAPRFSKTSAETPLPQNEKADVSMIGLRSFFATPVTQEKAESRTADQHDLQIETAISSPVSSTPTTPKRSTRASSVSQSITNVAAEPSLVGSEYDSDSKEITTPKQAPPISKTRAKTPLPQNEKADVSMIELRSFFATSTPVTQEKAQTGSQTPDNIDLRIQTVLHSPLCSTSATPKRSTRSSSVSQDITNVGAITSVLGSDYASESKTITTAKQVPPISKTSEKTPLPQNVKADVSLIGLRSFFATPTSVAQEKAGSRTPDQDDLHIQTGISSPISSTSVTPKRSTRSSSVSQGITNVDAETSLVGSDYETESEEITTPKQVPPISKASAKTPLPQNEKADVSMIGLRSFFATPTPVTQEKAESRTPDQHDLQIETTISSPVSSTPTTPKRSTRASSVSQSITNVAAETSLVGSHYGSESEEITTPKQAPLISKTSEKTPLPQNVKADVSLIGLRSFFATPTSVAQEKAGSRTPDQDDLHIQTGISSPISSTSVTPKRSTRSSSVSQGITNVDAETSLAGSDYESESEEITTPKQVPPISKASAKTPLPQNEKADVSMIGLRSFFATPTAVTQEKAGCRTPDQHDLPIQTAINVPVSSTPATPKRSTRASSVFQSTTNVVADTSLVGSNYVSESKEITPQKQAPPISKASAKTPLPQNEKADVSMIALRSFFATPTLKSLTRRSTSVTEEAAVVVESKTRSTRGQRKEENDSVPEAKETPAKEPKTCRTRHAPLVTEDVPVVVGTKPRRAHGQRKEEKDSVPEVRESPAKVTKTSRSRRAPSVSEVAAAVEPKTRSTRGQRKEEKGSVPEVKESPAKVTRTSRTRRTPAVSEVKEAPTPAKVAKKSQTQRAASATEEAPVVGTKTRRARGQRKEEKDSVPEVKETPAREASSSRLRRATSVVEVKEAPSPVEISKKSRTRRAPAVTEVKEAPSPAKVAKKSRTRRAASVTEETAAAVESKTRSTRGQRKEEKGSVPEVKESPTPAKALVAKKSQARRAASVMEGAAAAIEPKTRSTRGQRKEEMDSIPEVKETAARVTKTSRSRRATSATEVAAAVESKTRSTRGQRKEEKGLVPEVKESPAIVTRTSRTRRTPAVTEVKEAPTPTKVAKKSQTRRAVSVTKEAATVVEPETRKTRGQRKEDNDSVPEVKEKSASSKRSRSVKTEVKETPAPVEGKVTTKIQKRRGPTVADEVVAQPITKKTTRGQRKEASESTAEVEVKVKEKPSSRKRSRPITMEVEAPVTKSRARARRTSPDEEIVEAKKKKVQEEKQLDEPHSRSLRRRR